MKNYRAFLDTDKKLQLKVGTTKKVVAELIDRGIIEFNINFYNSSGKRKFIEKHLHEYRKFFTKDYCGLARIGIKQKCIDLMEDFMHDNTFEWSTICKAAEYYIRERKNSDRPDLISQADNFIYYSEGGPKYSRLAKYCEMVESDQYIGISTNQSFKTEV